MKHLVLILAVAFATHSLYSMWTSDRLRRDPENTKLRAWVRLQVKIGIFFIFAQIITFLIFLCTDLS